MKKKIILLVLLLGSVMAFAEETKPLAEEIVKEDMELFPDFVDKSRNIVIMYDKLVNRSSYIDYVGSKSSWTKKTVVVKSHSGSDMIYYYFCYNQKGTAMVVILEKLKSYTTVYYKFLE